MFEYYTITMYPSEIDEYIDSLVVYNGKLTPFYEEVYMSECSVFDPVTRKWVMVYP